MALLLKEEHVREVLTMPDAIDAVERAFRALAPGKALNMPRQPGSLPGGEGRTSPARITIFESQGIGLEDLAIAECVYDLAQSRGGIEIPLR